MSDEDNTQDPLGYLRTKLNYQNLYIKMLESELYKHLGESQMNIYREEASRHDEISLFLKNKLKSLSQLSTGVQEKLDSYNEAPLFSGLPENQPPPNDYILSRYATISCKPLSLDTKQIILRWSFGNTEMGNSLYLKDREILNIESIGHLVERFFYEVCKSRIDLIKGKKNE